MQLSELCSRSVVLENEPMSRHTTFKIGGPARYFVSAGCVEDVRNALVWAKENGYPTLTLGRGSNMLVADEGLDRVVIEIGDAMSSVTVNGTVITAQAGARLSAVALEAARNGLSGMEPLSGIPGNVGGGVAMNAGAYNGQIADCLTEVTLIEDGEIRTVPASEMELGYRTSRALKRGGVILAAVFTLTPDGPAAVMERINDFNRRRREKQPLSYPSAGSVFKRPEGHFAGALIQEAGLKGARVGGAMVSEMHAGFIVNTGGATAKDVCALIDHIRHTVLERSGVELEPEIRLIH